MIGAAVCPLHNGQAGSVVCWVVNGLPVVFARQLAYSQVPVWQKRISGDNISGLGPGGRVDSPSA